MLERLDIRTDGALHAGGERRNEQRKELCKSAEVWMFDASGEKQRLNDALMHNSSFTGLAIIAKMEEPIRIGRPLELILRTTSAPAAHMAGTVTFCRSAGAHYYDIGVCIKAVGSHWIVANDIPRARARYDWFSRAMLDWTQRPTAIE